MAQLNFKIFQLIIIFFLFHHSKLKVYSLTDTDSNQCSKNEYTCQNGQCIDETGCELKECKIDEFKCNNGKCIQKNLQCNGFDDCNDLSDETCHNVPFDQISCPSGEFKCRNNRCISIAFVCDLENDCGDFSDEEKCGTAKCASGGFLCNNGDCISAKLVCDGSPNCSDESDELLNSTCLNNAQPCREDGQPCQHLCKPIKTGHQCACRQGYQLANDLRSCLDIDECNSVSKLHCSQQCENTVPGYICTCLDDYELLPDQNHCRAIDKQPMRLLYANRIDIHWLLPPDQFQPYYNFLEYYNRQKNNLTFNSSFENTNVSQKINMPFEFDEKHKELTETWLYPFLQNNISETHSSTSNFATTSSISNSQILLNNLQNAVSIDFHWATGRIYWADITQDAIYTMHINGTAIDGSQLIRPIVQAGLVSPSGICVDWVNNFVIWTDSGTSRIELSDLDGGNRHVLLHKDVKRPRDIVVFPKNSIIFWTDWGDSTSNSQSKNIGAKIERAYIDGSGRQCIVCNSKLYWPNGLTIDYPAERIYWIDAKRHIIESSNLDGSSRRIVIQSSKFLPHPFSLTIFEDNVYWTDWHFKSVHSVSKLNSVSVSSYQNDKNFDKDKNLLPPSLLVQKLHFPMDIVAVHPVRQTPLSKYNCYQNNCSHICLPNDVSYICACPSGYQIGPDGFKCDEQPHHFLLFSRRSDIRWLCVDCKTELIPSQKFYSSNLNSSVLELKNEQLSKNFTKAEDAVLPLQKVQTAVSIDFDFLSRTIFWSDITSDTISKAAWNGTDQKVLITQPLESPAGVAVDWIGKNLYWTDSGRNLIECSTLNGEHRTVLIHQRLQRPKDITLDSSVGLLFWTHSTGINIYQRDRMNNQNSLNQPQTRSGILERSSLDGSHRMQLIAGDQTLPRALTLDYSKKRIYFCDINQKQIESVNYEGGDRKLLLKSVHPYALTLHSGFLYWTDWQAKRLQRAKIENLEPNFAKSYDEVNSFSNSSKNNVETLLSGLDYLMDIKMFHNDRPTRIYIPAYASNNCSSLDCEQLCLLNEKHGGQCRCSTGITLDHNSRTCARDMRRYLLIAKRTAISRISLDVPYFAEVTMKLNSMHDTFKNLKANLSNVITVDADISHRTIYWTDTNLKRIFAYQYATSMSGKKINNNLSKLKTKVNENYHQASTANKQIKSKVIMNNKKKNYLGRNMTLIWKNVMGKVVGWISGNNINSNNKNKINTNKTKIDKISHYKSKILSRKVSKSSFGLGNVRTVHKVGIQDVNGLAVDVLGRKLYWTDAIRKKIEVSHLNGKQRKILIYKDLDSPRAISLHHRCGLMFWADWGNSVLQSHQNTGKSKQIPTPINCLGSYNNHTENQTPCSIRIERADMDGNHRSVLVNTQLGWPNGLTTIYLGTSSSYTYASYASLLNSQTEDACSLRHLKLIWTDSRMRTLEMVDLDGSNRKILVRKLNSPYGIAALNGAIYWSDWETRTIYTVNLEQAKSRNGSVSESLIVSEPRSILTGLLNIVDIRLVNRDELMAQVSNGTLIETQRQQLCKACSDLCLRHSAGYSCACPTGVLMQADQHTCHSEMSTFLIFANKHNILRISLDTDDYNEVHLDLVHLENVVSVDFDYRNKRIYYSDVNLDQIASTNFDGSELKIHISNDLHTVDGIAIDWVASNLYFSDTGRDVIEVSRMNGSSRKILISTDLDEPRALAVHPVDGFLFWTDWGKTPKIERSYLDGSNRIILVDTNIGWPNGLAIDYIQSRLYWTDAQLDRIESIDFDGQNRNLVISNVMHPYGVTIYGSYVYWTDWQNKAIERADKFNGSHRQVIADAIDYLMEIKMVTPSRETEINPCGIQNGGCSHLCLFRPQGYICACPQDYETKKYNCSTVPGEIVHDNTIENKFKTEIIDDYIDEEDDDEFILVTENPEESSIEEPKEKNSLNEDKNEKIQPPLIQNPILIESLFNQTIDCDEETEDCSINKFSLEDSFFKLASLISSFAVLLFVILFFFIVYIICKSRKRRQQNINSHSKLNVLSSNSIASNNVDYNSKNSSKLELNRMETNYSFSNGHQLMISTLPREGYKNNSIDKVLGSITTPPSPTLFSIPVLSLPSQTKQDIFENQNDPCYLHHRHHLHLHQHHQQILDQTTFNPTNLVFDVTQNQIKENYPYTNYQEESIESLPMEIIEKNKLNCLPTSSFNDPSYQQNFKINETNNSCSYCNYGYELLDCHNFNIPTSNSCNLLLLQKDNNYHNLHHSHCSNKRNETINLNNQYNYNFNSHQNHSNHCHDTPDDFNQYPSTLKFDQFDQQNICVLPNNKNYIGFHSQQVFDKNEKNYNNQLIDSTNNQSYDSNDNEEFINIDKKISSNENCSNEIDLEKNRNEKKSLKETKLVPKLQRSQTVEEIDFSENN